MGPKSPLRTPWLNSSTCRSKSVTLESLRPGVLAHEVFVDPREAGDGVGDVAGVDLVAALERPGRLRGGAKRQDDFWLVALARDRVVDGEAARFEHLFDEVPEIGQRFGRS